MTAIEIPSELLAQLYAHARTTFPDECCGYLVGPRDAGHVDLAIECRNAQPDGAHPSHPERTSESGYVISGRELIAFARTFDGPRPARIVYHSHPNGRAYFSAIDHSIATVEHGPAYPVQHVVIGVTADAVTEVAQLAWSEAERCYIELARWRP